MPKEPTEVVIPKAIAAENKFTIRTTAPEPYREAFLNHDKQEDLGLTLADIQHSHYGGAD